MLTIKTNDPDWWINVCQHFHRYASKPSNISRRYKKQRRLSLYYLYLEFLWNWHWIIHRSCIWQRRGGIHVLESHPLLNDIKMPRRTIKSHLYIHCGLRTDKYWWYNMIIMHVFQYRSFVTHRFKFRKPASIFVNVDFFAPLIIYKR